jgi:hypothetical protein
MKETYLEVTFRHGRPLAAYLYLPRRPEQKSYRSCRVGSGLVVDLSRSGRPIGIEITAPEKVRLAALNRVLQAYGMPEIAQADLSPRHAG